MHLVKSAPFYVFTQNIYFHTKVLYLQFSLLNELSPLMKTNRRLFVHIREKRDSLESEEFKGSETSNNKYFAKMMPSSKTSNVTYMLLY